MARKGSTKVPEYTPHFASSLPAEPDLLAQLSLEHRQIQRMWAELQRAHQHQVGTGDRVVARVVELSQYDLGCMIVKAMADHEAYELDALYPAAARVMSGEWADSARVDHADFRELLREVDGEDPEEEGVFEVFAEVMARVLPHFDEEERVVFPIMRLVLSPAELVNTAPLPDPQLQLAPPSPSGPLQLAPPSPSQPLQLAPPPPDMVDLATAERETPHENGAVENGAVENGAVENGAHGNGAAANGGAGNGAHDGNGRKDKNRRKLLRR